MSDKWHIFKSTICSGCGLMVFAPWISYNDGKTAVGHQREYEFRTSKYLVILLSGEQSTHIKPNNAPSRTDWARIPKRLSLKVEDDDIDKLLVLLGS